MIINEEDNKLKLLVLCLAAKLGRLPTEDEVSGFINGSKEQREAIWNIESLEEIL